jgi:hypothetical protein
MIFNYNKQHFNRRKGHSLCKAASYRCGGVVTDYYYGEIHNYTNKPDVVYSTVIAPPGIPSEFNDREYLWNVAENAERRKDARLGSEVRVALPKELPLNEQIPLISRYVADNFVSLGQCADISIHNKGEGNVHSHIMLTSRTITEEGEFGNKNRDWDKKALFLSQRENWRATLEELGFNERNSHKEDENQD